MTDNKLEPESQKHQDKLNTITEQFNAVLDDYKKYYIFSNKNPEVDEYQNYYLENKSQLQNLNKDVFLISNDIESNIEKLNYIVTRLNAKLSGEKELTGELNQLLQHLNDTDNGATIMLYDTTYIYNKKYIQNIEIGIGGLIMIYLLFTTFTKK